MKLSKLNMGRRLAKSGAVVLLFLLVSRLFVASLDARRNGKNIPGTVVSTSTLCIQCHSGSLNQNGSVSFSGVPASYVPGMTYNIGITITGGVVYGLQLASFFAGDSSQAGTLTPLTSGLVSQDKGSVTVLVHSPVPLISGTVDFQWTAPSQENGDVILRTASNSANNNFSTSGDFINTLQVTIPPAPAEPPAPPEPEPELTEELVITHLGNGGGLQSDVVVFNPSSTATATGEVNFFGDDGTLLDSGVFLPGGNSFTLSPLGTATLSTDGAGDLLTGSATVASDIPISAVIRFDITGVGVAGVEASQVLTSAIAPVRRVGTLNSGVAFRNTGTSSIQVTLELKDASGNVVSNGTETRTLAGNAKVAEFLDTLFPNAQTATFTGTICVTTQSGQIAVIALELDAFNNVFTTLPVSAIN